MDRLIVQKYGGTSVATPERIRNVARRIAERRSLGFSVVVVVSAMGRTTDDLLALAAQVSTHPPDREIDMLLTVGERISMALLSMALADLGVGAISLTGSQSGILTSNHHRRARIQKILGDRVRAGLLAGQVVIIAGFQGMSLSKEITTLGRGGSDTSAVALAVALGAERCEIYSDVDGVFSADPSEVPSARKWDDLPFDLMSSLAQSGAGVLHPRSVDLAKKYAMPIHALSSMNLHSKGTLIRERINTMEEFKIVGITADEDKMKVVLRVVAAQEITSFLGLALEQRLALLFPEVVGSAISFSIDGTEVQRWKEFLEQWKKMGKIAEFSIDEDRVPVTLVGDCFSQNIEPLVEVLDQVHTFARVGSIQQGVNTIRFWIDKKDQIECLRLLHRRFIEENA